MSSLKVGLFYPHAPSVHYASRAVADANPDVLDMDVHRELITTAERVGFDYAFIANRWTPYGPASVEAMHSEPNLFAPLLAAALAACTSRIGLVTTIHTSYFHPAHVARYGANLDVLSRGRWAFNIVTGFTQNERDLFGLEEIPHDERYAMADEFLDVVEKLWRGDDTEHVGRYYRCRGPIVGPRPVQTPRPLLINAGASAAGRDFAARHADWVFMVVAEAEDARRQIDDVVGRARTAGRTGEIGAMLAASVVVRDTDDEAAEVERWILDSLDPGAARAYASSLYGGIESYRDMVGKDSGDEESFVRSMASSGFGYKAYGAPETVAARLVDLVERSGCAGLALTFPLWHPEEIARFGEQVLPLLEEAGLWSPAGQEELAWTR